MADTLLISPPLWTVAPGRARLAVASIGTTPQTSSNQPVNAQLLHRAFHVVICLL